jgi:DNA-binding NtrC family response regulator
MTEANSKPAALEQSKPSDESNRKRRILIAEDSATARKHLQHLLENGLDVVVDTVADGSEALEALTDQPYSVVVTDLKMPKVSGLELIEEVKKRGLEVAVIVTTGHGSIDDAVQAMRLGATDFLTKPIDIEHLKLILQRALREQALQDEVTTLREQLRDQHSFHRIVSKNPKMHAVFELIGHVAAANSTILVEGQTGTGKELVARAIHEASPRAKGPFIAINCAAVPETLLESELFGHEKGAFTSAVAQRRGRFELADGGTFFLDEVGDVPASMQAKLLRVLQERRFERVGGSTSVEVDVRLISATNRSLTKLVEAGKFREDLYYRLNVVKIQLPPLYEREEDIPLLVAHFTEKYARPNQPPKQVAPEAMELLLNYRWPGNIRELENAIERACVTSRDEYIRPENLPPEISKPTKHRSPLTVDLSRPLRDQLTEVVAVYEERFLRRALRKARGHMERVAGISGLSKRELAEKLARYKIKESEFSEK